MNPYHARLAEATGFKALYVSGGGVAAGSCSVPDLGITTQAPMGYGSGVPLSSTDRKKASCGSNPRAQWQLQRRFGKK